MKLRLLLWLLAISITLEFISLGRWQLHSGEEKQRMLDAVAHVLVEHQPQPLAALSLSDSNKYAWASGHGHFFPRPALLLDNQRHGEAVGIRVYRLFQPAHGRVLLVDLGWLPLAGNRALPSIAVLEGEQDLTGLLTSVPSSGLALGPAYVELDRERWLLTRIDLAALSQKLNVQLAPRVLRLDPALPMGYARDLDILPNTLPPERHRGYAVQWFGLAGATLAFALFLTFRKKRPL